MPFNCLIVSELFTMIHGKRLELVLKLTSWFKYGLSHGLTVAAMEPLNNCQATLTLHKSSHSLAFTFARKYGISFKVAEFLASFDFMRTLLN